MRLPPRPADATLRTRSAVAATVATLALCLVATACGPASDEQPGGEERVIPTTGLPAPQQPVDGAGPTPDATAGTGAFAPTDADLAAIDALLERRARAVRQRDRDAFLATVDPRTPDVVADQRVLFDNLAQLDLRTFGYLTSPGVLTPDPVVGDDPVLRVQTVERVELAGTLLAPIGNLVRMTYVRRDGAWLVGNETTPPAAATASPGSPAGQPRPWFGRPIEVASQGDLVAMADAADAGFAQRLVGLVTDAIAADAALLGIAQPEERVIVDATSNGEAVRMNSLESAEAAAVFVSVFNSDANGRLTRLAGGAIRINPAMSAEELEDQPGLLRHELVHFLLRRYSGAAPTWATEGIAEYARWYPLTLRDLVVPDRLWRRIQRSEPELPVVGLFSLDPRRNYLVGQAAVQHLVSRGGPQRFLDLLDRYVSEDGQTYGDGLTPRLLREVYGLSARELAREAWADLAELGHPVS